MQRCTIRAGTKSIDSVILDVIGRQGGSQPENCEQHIPLVGEKYAAILGQLSDLHKRGLKWLKRQQVPSRDEILYEREVCKQRKLKAKEIEAEREISKKAKLTAKERGTQRSGTNEKSLEAQAAHCNGGKTAQERKWLSSPSGTRRPDPGRISKN
jgi:hypothetical protein